MCFINRYIGSFELWPIKTALVAVLLTLLMSFPLPVFAQSAACDSMPAEKPIGNLDIDLVDCIFKNGFEACLAEIIGYRDSDLDGFGDLAGEPSAFCHSLPSGFADNALDCDDGNDARFPGNIESCDSLDNDCNGVIDEGFFDLGMACSVGTGMCNRIGTYVCSANGSSTICNAVEGSPQTEICDGLDNNCDGEIDERC